MKKALLALLMLTSCASVERRTIEHRIVKSGEGRYTLIIGKEDPNILKYEGKQYVVEDMDARLMLKTLPYRQKRIRKGLSGNLFDALVIGSKNKEGKLILTADDVIEAHQYVDGFLRQRF